MARVKGGPKTRHRRKKWLKLAKGFRGKGSKCYRIARVQVMKALLHAYRDRKKKKRDFRRLAILNINAKCREFGIPYSRFIWALNQLNIRINRKELALLANENSDVFKELVERAKKVITP